MRNYKDFEIWHLSMDLLVELYHLAGQLPDAEKFGLQSQLKRAVVSIPANIAEGCSRSSDKAFARFLEIALGSAFEVETLLLAGIRLGFFPISELTDQLELLNKIQRKINALLSKLRS